MVTAAFEAEGDESVPVAVSWVPLIARMLPVAPPELSNEFAKKHHPPVGMLVVVTLLMICVLALCMIVISFPPELMPTAKPGDTLFPFVPMNPAEPAAAYHIHVARVHLAPAL